MHRGYEKALVHTLCLFHSYDFEVDGTGVVGVGGGDFGRAVKKLVTYSKK